MSGGGGPSPRKSTITGLFLKRTTWFFVPELKSRIDLESQDRTRKLSEKIKERLSASAMEATEPLVRQENLST